MLQNNDLCSKDQFFDLDLLLVLVHFLEASKLSELAAHLEAGEELLDGVAVERHHADARALERLRLPHAEHDVVLVGALQ